MNISAQQVFNQSHESQLVNIQQKISDFQNRANRIDQAYTQWYEVFNLAMGAFEQERLEYVSCQLRYQLDTKIPYLHVTLKPTGHSHSKVKSDRYGLNQQRLDEKASNLRNALTTATDDVFRFYVSPAVFEIDDRSDPGTIWVEVRLNN